MSDNEYVLCKANLPPEGEVVLTKIDDAEGVRNEQKLKRRGRLWFHPDGFMYAELNATLARSADPNKRVSEKAWRELPQVVKECEQVLARLIPRLS